MKLIVVVFVTALLASQAFAQATPATQTKAPAQTEAGPAASTAKPVGADETVITVDGVCQKPDAQTDHCKTAISRADFEKLVAVLSRYRNGQAQQTIPSELKRQLAVQYSRLLLLSDVAEKHGLQDTPEGKELIRFVRLQAMTEELARALQRKITPTAEQVQNYYDHNRERYTQWNLQRVVIPLSPTGNKQELKRFAEELRHQASDGADFAALQKESYEKAGIKNPPGANLVLMPGASPPEAHSSVYRLKPGELSPVIEDARGFYVYKLESSSLSPLAGHKAEIEEILAAQQAQGAIQKLIESNKVTLNSDYFELPHANAAPKSSSIQPSWRRWSGGDALSTGDKQLTGEVHSSGEGLGFSRRERVLRRYPQHRNLLLWRQHEADIHAMRYPTGTGGSDDHSRHWRREGSRWPAAAIVIWVVTGVLLPSGSRSAEQTCIAARRAIRCS